MSDWSQTCPLPVSARSRPAAIRRPSQQVDYDSGPRPCRQRHVERRVVDEHGMRAAEKVADLCGILIDIEREAEHLGDPRQLVAFLADRKSTRLNSSH